MISAPLHWLRKHIEVPVAINDTDTSYDINDGKSIWLVTTD